MYWLMMLAEVGGNAFPHAEFATCCSAGVILQVLCMTVECGFGGQKFQEQVLNKVGNVACHRYWCSCNAFAADLAP
jgi:hypothetical protein